MNDTSTPWEKTPRFFAVLFVAFFFAIGLTCAFAFPTNAHAAPTAKFKYSYGVFIGVNPGKAKVMKDYQTVVIDAAYYSKAQITKLKKQGHTVYSYLNVGSIEDFRSYYKSYKKYALRSYDNWPGEYWMDVSKTKWQNFVVNTLAKRLHTKGIDGFFLDNLDVYYLYKKPGIYNGVKKILKGLAKYKRPILVNGGDEWVKKACMSRDYKLIDGVNQECVFTGIDFNKRSFKKQRTADTKYFKNYLAKCKKKGLTVYLLEYTKNSRLKKTVQNYCKKTGYSYYVSRTIGLT